MSDVRQRVIQAIHALEAAHSDPSVEQYADAALSAMTDGMRIDNHMAAALEPLLREREAKALEDAAADARRAPADSGKLARWLRDRAATHREQP